MSADRIFLLAGLCLLLAVLLPAVLRRLALSPPIVLVAVGIGLGFSPLTDGLPLDPARNHAVIEHVTELAVLIALMGVGLSIERPLSLRDRGSWRAWSNTWRLLLVAMPLCIALVAGLGYWAGLSTSAALLLGAALAPTDPVLASDVQVGKPTVDADEQDGGDEVRFALTSEAGLNDGLAFPFVYAAILLASGGSFLEWLGWYALGKVALGVLAGVLVGGVLGWLAFRSPSSALRLAERGEPLMVLAALLTSYGVAELVGGYGFLAVFATAMTMRATERHHEYHRAMHDVVERLELLLTLLALLFLGMAMSAGLLDHLDAKGVAIGLVLLLVIRPLSAMLALSIGRTRGSGKERAAIAFFGIRGIGSVYYLAYAAGKIESPIEPWLWSTVGFTIVASVVLHGILATPWMSHLDRTRATG